ncbi:MAG: hypothetical protein CMJ19_20690 [Phycisphaeraceae bacterium]|nr:hypothetical protein [Phycisphaeraceae bacterium]
MFKLGRLAVVFLAFAGVMSSVAQAELTITVGDHSANSAGEIITVDLSVTNGGGQEIDGMLLNVVLGGDLAGPTFVANSVDLTTGTVFAGGFSGAADDENGVNDREISYSVSTPNSNDIAITTADLATFQIDTTGAGNNRYGIVLESTTSELSAFALNGGAPATTLVYGSISIGDNPIVIWSGDGSDSNLTNYQNWLYQAAPLAGDSLQFAGTTNTTVNMDQTANTAYHSITFDNTAQGFVLDGNAIGIDAGGSITNNSTLQGSYDFGEGAEPIGQLLLVDIKASGDLTLDAAAGDLTFDDSNISMTGSSTLTIDGGATTTVDVLSNILGSSAIVDVQTSGNLILAGTNTFMTLNINSGTVEFENGNAMSNTGSVSVADGATLLMNSDNEQIGTINAAAGSTINLGTSILIVGGTGNSTFAGTIIDTATPDENNEPGDAGGLVLLTDGTVTFNFDTDPTTGAANSYSLATVIGNNANALDQQNTLWDTTVDMAPTVVYDNNNAFGDGVIVFNKGTLDNSAVGGTNTLANDMQIGGDVSFVGKVDLAGTVSLDASSVDNDDVYGSDVTSTSRTITVVNASDEVNIRGILDADTDLVKAGAGLLELTGDNNSGSGVFRGDITIDGGTVNVTSDSSAAGDIIINNGEFIANSAAGLAVNTDSTVSLTSSNATFTVSQSQAVGELNGVANSSVVIADGQVLSLNAANFDDNLADTTFAGVISGAGGVGIDADAQNDLTDTPPGIVKFSGANTYTGPTNVNSGALLIASGGSIVSDVTVGNTGILGGQGNVNADVTVQSGGEITAVDSDDPTTDSAETFNINGNVDVEAGGRIYSNIGYIAGAATYDQLNIDGTLTLANGAILDIEELAGSSMIAGEEFIIASTTGGVTNAGANIEEDIAGFSFEASIVNNNLILTSMEQVEAVWIGGNGNFSTEADWDNDPDGVQSDAQDLILIFEGTGSGQNYAVDADEAPYSNVGGIVFQGDNIFTITSAGDSIEFNDTLSAAIINNTTNTQTIENDLVTSSIVDLDINAASGDLALSGNITNNNQLTFTGDNDTAASGVISGSGAMVKNDAGILTLTGTNTYTGDTTLNAGTIVVGNDSALGIGGTLNIAGGTLESDNDVRTIANDTSVTGDFTVSGNNMTLSGDMDLNAGTHTLTASNTQTTLSGSLSNGTLGKSGAGTVILSGANTLSGLDVNAGAVTVSNASGLTGITAVNLTTAGAQLNMSGVDLTIDSLTGAAGTVLDTQGNKLTIDGSQTTTFAGEITNAGGGQLEHAGTGQLTLSGDNTYEGTTTISDGTVVITGSVDGNVYVNGGTFVIGNDNALNSEATLIIGSGNLQSDNDARVLNAGVPISVEGNFAVTGSNELTLGGAVNLNSGTRTITITESDQTTALAGVISTGGLVKSGAGQLNLTGANTFSDGFTLNAGTVGIGNDAALGNGIVTINGGTIAALGEGEVGNDVDVNADFTIAGGADIDAVLSGDIDLSGGDANHLITISNPGTTSISGDMTGGDFTKSGSGQLTLTGTNNFVNGVTVNEGLLRFNHANAISADDDLTLTGTGSVDINDDMVVDVLTGTGTGTIDISGNSLKANSGSVANVIEGAGTLEKDGAGTLTLSGTNTYSGTTQLTDGILEVTNNNALGTSAITANGGTLRGTVDGINLDNNVTLNSDLTVDQDTGIGLTLSGILSGGSGLFKEGDGDLTLSGANTFTGDAVVNGGSLALSGGSAIDDTVKVNLNDASADLTLNNNETIGNLIGGGTVSLGSNTLTIANADGSVYGGVISGTGGLTVDSTDETFILSGANTYTGDTTITDGTLLTAGSGVIADTSDVNVTGTLTLGGSETVGDLSGSGTVDNGGNSFTFGDDEDTTFSGILSGAGDVTYQGSGVFTHSGDSTYTGDTNINGGTFNVTGTLDSTALTILNGATLQLSKAGGSSLVNDANIEVTNGTFDVDTDQQIADLDQSANGTTELAADLTISGDTESTSEIAGSVTGTGDLNIAGETTVNLTGTNSSTGSTNVSGNNENEVASYNIQGTSSAGTLNINSFGQVDLTGTAGDVNVNNNGLLRTTQGAVDTATINGDLTVSDGGTLDVDISNNNGTLTNDVYNVDGNVNLLANAIVAINDIGPSAVALGNAFEFVTYTGTNDGAANMDQVRLQESLSDVAFSMSDNGSGLTLTAIEVQDIVWDGEGNDGLFSTTNNWDDDVNGVTFNTDTAGAYDLEGFGLTFSGASNNGGNITADNGGNGAITDYINIASIQFLDTTEDMTLSGLDLNFIDDQTTDIINNSSNNHNIDNNIVTGNTAMTISANTADLFFEGTIQNDGGITVTGGNDTYLNDVVSGDGSLSKTGSGTLELTAANTYTGGTTMAAGRVIISDVNSFGTGDLALNGGTLESNGVATIGNDTTIGGNVTFDGSNMDFTGSVDLGSTNASRTLTMDAGTDVTFSNVLSGSNNLIKDGDGGLILSGENSHTGNITVNDGNLTLSGNAAMGDAALLTVNDDGDTNTGSVTVTGDETIGALTGDGTVDLTGSELTLAGSQTAVFTGVLTNDSDGSVTYSGTGSQTLAGDNTYTGDTTVTSGTLVITGSVDGNVNVAGGTFVVGADDAIADGKTLNIASGNIQSNDDARNLSSGVAVNVNGNVNVTGSNDLQLGGDVDLNSGTRTVDVNDAATTLTLSGDISNGRIVKDGAGELLLSGDNAMADVFTNPGIQLNEGQLTLGSDTALGTGSLHVTGGTIASNNNLRIIANAMAVYGDFSFAGSNLEMSGDISLRDNSNIAGTDTDHTVTVNNQTTLSGDITGGDLTIAGTGTLSLSGNNDFTNGVTVTAAILSVDGVDALADDDSLTINGGTVDINAATTVSDLAGTSGTLNLDADLTFGDDTSNELASTITGAGGLIFNGTGTQTISGDNSEFTGDTTLNSGTTVAGSNTAFGTGTIIANGGTLRSGETAVTLGNDITLDADTTFRGSSQLTLTGVITGENTFTKNDSNTVILTGASDFDTLAILGGEVILNHTGGGTLASDTGLTIANTGSTLTLGVDQTFGFVNTNADTQINLGANTLTIDYDGGDNSMAGEIAGTGGFVKEGTNELTFSGTNTYTGPTTINEGILSLAGGNAIADTGDVIVNAGGTLNLDADETIGSLATGTTDSLQDTALVELGSFNLTIADLESDTVFAGIIQDTADAGTVTYNSSNTMKFVNANTFGRLDITAGTIDMDDSLLSGQDVFDGDVNINGGTLIGEGGIGGALNLISGTLSIGHDSTGTITVGGDFNAAADGNMIFELTGGQHDIVKNDVDGSDVLSVDGNVVLANGTTLTLVLNDDDDLAEEGDFYDIILAGGTLTAGDLTLIDAALIQTSYEVIDGDTLRVTLENLLDFGEATTGSVNPLIGQALVLVAEAADNGNAEADALVEALGDLDQEGLNQYVKELNDGIDVSVLASRNILQLIQTFSQVLSNHLTARRSGMPVFAQQGDTTMLAGLTDDPHTLAQVAAQQDEAAPRTVPMQEWAAFGKLYGLFSDQETTSGRTGYSSDAVGIQLGMDYQVNENLIVGLSLDYTSTDVTFDSGYGDMDTDSFRVGPFASYFTDKWFIDASLTFGIHSSESTRNDTSTGAHDGDFDATDITLYLGGGYDFKLSEAWTLTPTASLRYTYYNRDAYTETGTGGIAYEEYDINTLHSRLGVRLAYQLNAMDLLMIPELMIGWEHEYLGEGDTVNGTFSGVGAFNVNTGNPDEDSVFFGAGLTAIVDEQWTTFIRYEGNVSADGETHGISGGVRYEF